MKRAIVYFMYLWILLLGGGQFMHAYTLPKKICESPSWDFVTKHHVKLKTLDSNSVLIEDTDVDFDEEFHQSDNLDSGDANNFVVTKQSLLDNWYLTFFSQVIFKADTKQIKTSTTPCGYSTPIYLKIGVFRI